MFLTVRTGYRGAMGELPTPLRVLEEDRGLLIRCLDALEATPVAVERADLAKETALLAARYENVLADAFYPQIVELLGTRSSFGPSRATSGSVAKQRLWQCAQTCVALHRSKPT